jgi:threonine synthase
LVVARAKEIDAKVVVTASTGNAGAALAGMAAAADHQAVIFAPRTAPPAKIAQLLIYQARVLLVDGSYDQAFDLSVHAADEFGWYCRNTGYNPFTIEGKKTAALEIWEQLLKRISIREPLVIFVSVGDGNIISGLHKGFKDLEAMGWLEQMPRIFGVQSEDSAAVANTFMAGDEVIHSVSASTRADSISVDLPRDGVRAVRAARETGGAYVTVPDDEIMAAIPVLGQVGIFAEPAGAAAFAGLKKACEEGMIKDSDSVLVLNTGSGLKDVQAAMMAVPPAAVIEPTLDAVIKALDL